MTYRRALCAGFCSALLLGLAWGCAAADDSMTGSPAGGGNSGIVGPGNDNDASVLMPDSGAQDSGMLRLNPLCGKIFCVPDLAMSCAMFTPPASSDEDASVSSDGSVTGQAGAKGDGGAGGDTAAAVSPGGAGGAGGDNAGGDSASSAAGAGGGAAGAAGAAGESGALPTTPPAYGCHVQRSADDPKVVFSACALAGPGAENAPCLTSNDCQPGFGCVGDQNTGLCQKYCCQDANDCKTGTYCAERPMRDATINDKGVSDKTALMIPVCIHAENCDLSAPYPCPKGNECTCRTGTACMVVRSDGTTTCAVPGTGKVGDACPCAWGHVCSAATNQCLQLCSTRESTCGDGRCQSASQLPDGWGVCVGG